MQTVSVNAARQKVNKFLTGPKYILALALLTALSFMVGGELVFYCVIALLAGYVCAFCDDLLPLTPVFVFVYVAPSVHSNPGRSGDTVFSGVRLVFVVLLGLAILGAFAYRIVRDHKRFFHWRNKLMPGILLLCAAYMLSGIGSRGYFSVAGKNFLFALGQCAGVLVPYWLFANGVNWKKARKDYLAWIGVGVGCLLLLEILFVYLVNDVVQHGVILRERVYTGWGMRNNVGCLLAMMIPFAFSLAVQHKKVVYGILGGAVFLIGVFLTTSRTSAIFGTAAYLACIALIFLHTDDKKRKLIAMLIAAGGFLLLVVAFHRPLFRLFSQALDDASELDSRYTIYKNGLKSFFRAPIFGTTFYPGKNMAWGWASADVRSVLPDRWHNTVIQLLASTGIVGMIAYLYHRVQTVKMVMKFRGREKWLTVISLGIMLLCSMLDCHFFNVGPTLFYSTALAFMEKQK